jgi:hypothetical protein
MIKRDNSKFFAFIFSFTGWYFLEWKNDKSKYAIRDCYRNISQFVFIKDSSYMKATSASCSRKQSTELSRMGRNHAKLEMGLHPLPCIIATF